MAQNGFDHDWLIVGSGFGGSVSALRLSEKGYRVAVLECGRRYRDEDYAASTWNLRRFMWAPALGLRGILRLTPFKDVFIASGSAVGGGSVVYACTLYRGAPEFFVNPQWAGLEDWAAALKPHYDTAERMLGVNTVPFDSDGQTLLKQVAGHFGVEDTFRRTPVGIYFGAPGQQVADPYFGGSGPARTGCTRCGACMVGCRVGAKNTLVKNYLWFAEKAGAQVLPEHEVVDIRPLGAADGSDGYRVTTERPGAWFNKQRRSFTTRGVVVSAGALGTNRLLAKCKHGGSLPGISDRLGELVRTNSESILAVTLPDDKLESGERRGDQRQHPSAARHAHRIRHLRREGRLHVDPVHDDHRQRHAADPAAAPAWQHRAPPAALREGPVAFRLGAAHRDLLGHADVGQRHRLPCQARLVRWHRPAHRTGSREAQPDLHPGGQRGRRMAGCTHRRYRPEHGARSHGEHSVDGAHPGRRGHRQGRR